MNICGFRVEVEGLAKILTMTMMKMKTTFLKKKNQL
jgi:hypothetical protein